MNSKRGEWVSLTSSADDEMIECAAGAVTGICTSTNRNGVEHRCPKGVFNSIHCDPEISVDTNACEYVK